MAQLDHHRLCIAVMDLRTLGRAVKGAELRLKLLELERLILGFDSTAGHRSYSRHARPTAAVSDWRR